MKKEWLNPELMNLGVDATREDELGDDAQTMTWHKCKYCGKGFWRKKDRDNHQATCINRPASPGFGPDGDVTPGLDATPIS